MNTPRRNRARVLTPEGLKKLRERVRSHEAEENAGFKYTLERLGELTGLDPETVKNVLDGKRADKSSIARCFESFGLVLEDGDHISAAQATAVTADPNFVGREQAIADLNALASRNAKVIVIQARGGVGKTTLARKYLQQEFGSCLEFPIAKETKDIASIEGLIEEKLRQLGEEPGREFWVSLDRLKRKLQAERIGILIDNLEPALDSAGKFIEAHRRYVELLRVLSDPSLKSITLITSRERLREADVTVQHYSLRSLDVPAWEQFFQSRNISVLPSLREDGGDPTLTALHNAYGGNAKAMDIISGAILEDFAGHIEAYWQANQDDLFIERDLEDLVTTQFNRLQQLDPDAYNLLCRMGCYRYQDVPTIPIEGLFCLLWDVPANRHRRVIKSLQDRSLVDSEDGEFWLHPVIRAEAIERLRHSENWKVANREAAKFWGESVLLIERLKDAVSVFEAYYHYFEIDELENSIHVIVGRISDRWGQKLSLGEISSRLGFSRKIIESIDQVIDIAPLTLKLCYLYRILGNANLINGKIKKAIEYQEKVRSVLRSLDNIDVDEKQKLGIKFYSFLSQGIYWIYLWELEKSEDMLCQSLEGAKVINHKYLYTKALCYLSFISSIKNSSNSRLLADEAYTLFTEIDPTVGSFIFHGQFLGLAYTNLGDFEKALNIYEQISSFFGTESIGYIPSQGKALLFLSEIHRRMGTLDTAQELIIESINILEKVEAKSELGEAYYKLGLIHQEIGKKLESQRSFQEAIQLFSEMEAPKQVERVRQSMQNTLQEDADVSKK